MNYSRVIFTIITLLLINGPLMGQRPVNNSLIAFTIPEKDLLPESVAYDSKTKAFFVGSTRKGKVIRIDASGQQTDFIKTGTHGQWMIIGMKIDSERRHLWLCSSGGSNLIGYSLDDEKEGRPAGIFKFNLDTGELIKKYILETPGEVHFFNDLVIAKNGVVLATHMFNEAGIYRITPSNDKLELLASDENIKFPNGLALADNGRMLFIAHSGGVSSLNLETKQFNSLNLAQDDVVNSARGIDGLYYYKWSLVGVKSGAKQVVQLMLNEDGTGFEESKVLEQSHPMMNRPTTGVLVGSDLYYIANAQFDNFNKDGSLFPMERMYEPVILKVNISK